MRQTLSILSLIAVLVTVGCGKSKTSTSSQTPSTPSKPAISVDTATSPAPDAPAPSGTAPAAPASGQLVPIAAQNTDEKPPDLNAITLALQQYVAQHLMDPAKLTEADLQKMVKEGFLKSLPPAPAGKKYVWNRFLEVSLANK